MTNLLLLPAEVLLLRRTNSILYVGGAEETMLSTTEHVDSFNVGDRIGVQYYPLRQRQIRSLTIDRLTISQRVIVDTLKSLPPTIPQLLEQNRLCSCDGEVQSLANLL